MQTTITVNGTDGERFLSSLDHLSIPRVLARLVESEHRSIEVDAADADAVAAFVDDVLDAGWIALAGPPLLFSPRLGDVVVMGRDLLVEIEAAVGPKTWRFVPRGTRGRLRDWCEAERGRVVIIDGTRYVALVGRTSMTRHIERPVR